MPSLQVFPQSGGIGLVSGNVYSGTPFPVGGISFRLDYSGAGLIYIGLPFPNPAVVPVSGNPMTFTSGGSLTSGGLNDGTPLAPGADYFIPKIRLTSGITTPRINCPAGSSGVRLFWDVI